MNREAPLDVSNYIHFGDVARDRCGMQCQYCRHYLAGEHGSPDLGSDLRWFGETSDYHKLQIHKDDADLFVLRVFRHRTEGGMGWTGEKIET